MLAAGALALALPDVAFSSPPPHRPQRPERRTRGGAADTALKVVRAVRRGLAIATDGSVPQLPRVSSRFPY